VFIIQLRCPGCGKWGDLDDDQLHGRVSTHHEECGFHETRDWSEEAEWDRSGDDYLYISDAVQTKRRKKETKS
jgi:hypothetical protein